jgi:hypothetical protein
MHFHDAEGQLRSILDGLASESCRCRRFDIVSCVVKDWRNQGLPRAHRYNDKGQCAYEPPADDLPRQVQKGNRYRGSRSYAERRAQRHQPDLDYSLLPGSRASMWNNVE